MFRKLKKQYEFTDSKGKRHVYPIGHKCENDGEDIVLVYNSRKSRHFGMCHDSRVLTKDEIKEYCEEGREEISKTSAVNK